MKDLGKNIPKAYESHGRAGLGQSFLGAGWRPCGYFFFQSKAVIYRKSGRIYSEGYTDSNLEIPRMEQHMFRSMSL